MPLATRRILILTTLAIAALHAVELPLAPGRTVEATIVHDGIPRLVLLHAPAVRRPVSLPLVLALHGGSGNAAGVAGFTGFDAIADREGFLVAYPQGTTLAGRPGQYWNDDRAPGTGGGTDADDVGFLRRLIDQLVAQGAVDRDRVFATGISNGGMMCHRLGRELADRVAAIAPVAAHLPLATPLPLSPSRPVAVAMFSGTDDTFMPYAGGEVTLGGIPMVPTLGVVRSADDTIARWIAANGAVRMPLIDRAYGVGRLDGCVVTRYRYDGPGRADVWFHRIDGGGHTWPGRDTAVMRMLGRVCLDIDASEEIWRFFSVRGRAAAGGRARAGCGGWRRGAMRAA